VGPRAGLDAVAKRQNPCSCRESNSRRSLFILPTELSRLSFSLKQASFTKKNKPGIGYAQKVLPNLRKSEIMFKYMQM